MIKRIVDIVVSLSILSLAFPFLLMVALAIRFNMGSPIFFQQRRPGIRGHIFTLVKFRTMKDAQDESGAQLSDEERITKLGVFLRKYSIDEFPQLMNVIKGDMSLVGPRPLLPEYLDLYTGEQMRRHEVKPGITGWAQVNGRNAITWEQKFAFDVWYVDNQRIGLDLKILYWTALKVIRKEGIHQEGHVTTSKFKGSKDVS